MRLAFALKQPFWFALYEGKTAVAGTLSHKVTYSAPVKWEGNISPASGQSQPQMFGIDVSYDNVIALSNEEYPGIDEYSVLWVGITPELDSDGNLAVDEAGRVKTPHNYIVKKVAKSILFTTLAISKVMVSG